jgi:hypothetical protein
MTNKRDAFSARRTAAPDDLQIDIAGVGALTIPVSAAQARKLCAIARPARYGMGEQTLTDPRVRNTWEVPKSRVRIDKQWRDRTLTPMLAALRGDLGLPNDCRLKAELHAVLVYAPGQFFVPHQDSEKSDAMVGTLSLILPGPSRGGALVIEHAGSKRTYRASDKLLTFVAFYADCRHEVRPVISGYRVVLTYNLMLVGDTTAATAPPPQEIMDELRACLEEHLTRQSRLVYLLDHQYTARGLHWSRLKGVDVARVVALRTAAQASDCEIALALSDVHETWSCAEPYDDQYWYDEDDDEEPRHAGLELEDLLDRSISLDCWVDQSGQLAQPIVSVVSDAEVCATTPTSKLAPYDSEYEGYMGNYGNTMDRWYRRGAVVVWPRRLDFAVRADASPSWALDTPAALLRDGEVARARELAGSVATFWRTAAGARASMHGLVDPPPGRPNLGQALSVAQCLDDEGLAAMLLAPFRLESLAPADAPALTAVAGHYSEGWMRGLLAEWETGWPRWDPAVRDRRAWIASLPEFCSALAPCGGGVVANLVLSTCWGWLATALGEARSQAQPSRLARDLDELADPIAGLLVGAAVSEALELRDAAVATLYDEDSPLRFVVNVLRRISDAAPQHRVGSGFDTLARHTGKRLEARLTQPSRDADDWSIDAPTSGCDCELCLKLGVFLADPTRQRLEWPLKEQSRRHVHSRIDLHELPVQHQTRRVGRPYTLVLVKMPTLFQREEQVRRGDEADLRWIRERLNR